MRWIKWIIFVLSVVNKVDEFKMDYFVLHIMRKVDKVEYIYPQRYE